MTALTAFDQDLRGLLARMIAARGHAPGLAELAAAAQANTESVEQSLRRLHDAHALLLHPHECEPWVVHPFALSAAGCWVETPVRGYWANCLYCGLGIAAALDSDAVITTRLGGEGETVRYRVESGRLVDAEGVFHLSVPAARWWDNVIFACASFQPFAREGDVDGWCERHAMARGAVMSLERLWPFARDWYGGCLRTPWRKRGPEQVRALFAAHGLTGPFWEV
jgi:hypothetical protein